MSDLILNVLERAENNNLLWKDRFTLFMDLDNSDLNWQKLNDFDDANFTHDIIGIQNNMNRETGQLDQHFLPRSGV
jgi:hypothetical protein